MTQRRLIDKVLVMEKSQTISGAISGARQLLDVMLPPTCPGCRAIVGPPGGLCPECWEKVTFISDPDISGSGCSICGHPFEFSGEFSGPSTTDDGPIKDMAICGPCAGETPPFGRARAAFVYDDASRKMVLAFKHADQTEWAGFFATMLMRAGQELIDDCDLIIPVPLSRKKLFSRRYNQSAEIARKLSKRSGKPFAYDLLSRIPVRGAKKASQGNLNRRARFENVRGVFKVPVKNASQLQGRSVLLVDDVLTTGATVRAASRALIKAGVKNVDVLTLALVSGPK